jgi:hypothetical protein
VVTVTPVFGEFWRPAAEHITAAVSSPGEVPADARRAVIRELGRLAGTLARYLGDLVIPDEFDPALSEPLIPEAGAAADAKLALRWAAGSLRPDAITTEDTGAGDGHPVVSHLSAAADLLAAGRDLLQTHFASDPSGARIRTSYWAPVITSWPVTAALLADLASHLRQLAPWAAHLALTGTQDPGAPTSDSLALQAASRWMQIAGAGVQAAQRQPVPAEARQLLAAIPANIPPAPRPPDETEPVPSLCEGVTITAERLRHAALTSAARARWSPDTTSVSWRRDALASAITTHSSAFILRLLAQRASQLGAGPAIQAQLRTAAAAMNRAWPAWYAVARQWDIISTGFCKPGSITPVAAEVPDLALRTGRLARRDPHWTPARTGYGLIRDPASLAPTSDDITIVLSAVHHATDAITRIAAEDRDAVRQAAADNRLYMPARLLPPGHGTSNQHYEYAPVPWLRARRLVATYNTAIQASIQITGSLDDLAAITGAPSRHLGHARAFCATQPTQDEPAPHELRDIERHARQAAAQAQPASLGEVVHDLAISEPAALLRAAAIDEAARALTAEAKAQSQRRAAATDLPTRLTTGPHTAAAQQPGRRSARILPERPPPRHSR